ncbi:endonuclease III [Methanoplanus limicola]|uniref:Endonuclease III n=1 Tax=Methanoplanus limicola DSM 2279 TaxID=937775 RepID=H1Z2Y1_9EURY|nr:endonuclease III [Methanoplanus limicola]EHQ34720.1 endonuclease III [Methanoplanus limicola DSM 2279]
MMKDTACRIFSVLLNQYIREDTNLNFLEFDNPFQILIMTILSAQTTDRTVNSVKGRLFEAYPDPHSMADAEISKIEEIIRPTGFYRAKSKNIRGASEMLVREYDGVVPDSMEELIKLPGVGRKTANIVLNHAYGIDAGIAVDTHVKRVSYRLGMTDNTDPDKIERDLTALYPQEVWGKMNFLLISHGRAVCDAKKPACERCCIKDYCRYYSNNNFFG